MKRSLLPLSVEGTWYALDAPLVVEVLGKRALIPIPTAPSRMPGVIAWQGRAIAVVELSGFAQTQSTAAARDRERVVVVRVGPLTLAIPADAVREVHDIEEDGVRPAHAVRAPYAAMEADLDGTTMPVLDLADLVRELSSDQKSAQA